MEAAAREARGARSCLNGQESDTGESVAKGPSGGRQSALTDPYNTRGGNAKSVGLEGLTSYSKPIHRRRSPGFPARRAGRQGWCRPETLGRDSEGGLGLGSRLKRLPQNRAQSRAFL